MNFKLLGSLPPHRFSPTELSTQLDNDFKLNIQMLHGLYVTVEHSLTFRSFQNVDIANLEFIGMGYAGNHIEDTERFELLFKYGGTALYVEFIEAMGARILNSTFISNLEAGVAPQGVQFLLGSKAEIEASTLHNNTSKGAS